MKSLELRQVIDSPLLIIKGCHITHLLQPTTNFIAKHLGGSNQQKVSMGNSLFSLFLLTLLLVGSVECNPNYREALAKSLLFFQGQRSGRIPSDQQIKWRSNSALFDGRLANVTLFFFFLCFYSLTFLL